MGNFGFFRQPRVRLGIVPIQRLEGLIKNDKGYWAVTIYSAKDCYLIPNKKNIYFISSYNAKANVDGTYTLRINPEGIGYNAIYTAGVGCRKIAYLQSISFPIFG